MTALTPSLPTQTIAQRRFQARLTQTGTSVQAAIQARLSEVFGAARPDGTRHGPKVSRTWVNWPTMVTVEVDPFTLSREAQKKDLLDPMFLAQLTRAASKAIQGACTVYGLDALPTGQADMSGVWYVALLQPLPPALPTGAPPPVNLPSKLVLDPYRHYLKGKVTVPLWNMGYDGKRLLWLPFDKMSNALYSGTTQWGKTSAWMTALLTAMLNHGPDQLRVAMIDPKGNCSAWIEGAPHLLTKVCRGYDVDAAERVVQAVHDEVQQRKAQMTSIGARTLQSYNERVEAARRLPYILFVFEEVDGMLADSETRRRKFLMFLRRVVAEGLAYGVRTVLVLQKADAEAVNSRLTSQCDTRVSVHCTTEAQFRVGMGPGSWALNRQLTTPGRAVVIISGDAQPRVAQMPYISDTQMMELTAHWRDPQGASGSGRGPHEPVAVDKYPISQNARRLVSWSLANLAGGRMTRRPLKNAFDCEKPQDGGEPVREDEIKTIQETLSRQGLLEGGGQGRAYRITAALQARVEQMVSTPNLSI